MNETSTPVTAAQLAICETMQAESERAYRDLSVTKAILSKASADFSEGPGKDYAKSKNKLVDMDAKIEQAEEAIKALTERYSELMDASDGEVTPEIREVQRTRTETREALDTLSNMLTAERLRIRKLWIQAVEPAQDLHRLTTRQRTHWRTAKVSGALAEALPTLSPSLALALILAPEMTAETLKAWAEQMKEAGLLPPHSVQAETVTPDLMDFTRTPFRFLNSLDEQDEFSPLFFARLSELVAIENDPQKTAKAQELRHLFDRRDAAVLTIPGGLNPADAKAWTRA